jgi:3-dehydroquinate synthase
MTRVRIRSSAGDYTVVVHKELLRVGRLPRALSAEGGRVVVITDRNVARHHGAAVEARLRKMGLEPRTYVLPPGEQSKKMAVVIGAARWMLSQGACRATPLLALGGGVVGDLAGLVASLYMRGLPFFQIPTTLLAQVDSSIGGKTAVDLPEGKNLLGTLWPPLAVWTWPGFLRTLSPRRVREGLAEVIKCGYVIDPALLDQAAALDPDNIMGDPAKLEQMLLRSVRAKGSVVSRDEHEKGERLLMNFGHTFGHAIERLLSYRSLSHGEAVGLGMRIALRVGVRLGLTDPRLPGDLDRRLSSLGLPISLPAGLSPRDIVQAARHDKKRDSDALAVVLVEEPGRAVLKKLESALLHTIMEDVL